MVHTYMTLHTLNGKVGSAMNNYHNNHQATTWAWALWNNNGERRHLHGHTQLQSDNDVFSHTRASIAYLLHS